MRHGGVSGDGVGTMAGHPMKLVKATVGTVAAVFVLGMAYLRWDARPRP